MYIDSLTYEQFMVLGDAELSRRFSMQDEVEQKEEVKKALAAGVPKATILTYLLLSGGFCGEDEFISEEAVNVIA